MTEPSKAEDELETDDGLIYVDDDFIQKMLESVQTSLDRLSREYAQRSKKLLDKRDGLLKARKTAKEKGVPVAFRMPR